MKKQGKGTKPAVVQQQAGAQQIQQMQQNAAVPAQAEVEEPEQLANPPVRKVWGDHSFEDICQIGNAMYEEIVFWRKNLFKLPTGAAGKRYLREMTRLINICLLYTSPSPRDS